MKSLCRLEQEIILDRYEKFNYNKTHTARSLGIGIRTLQRKLKRYLQKGPLFDTVPTISKPTGGIHEG
jgi:DNA-binding NtrC family response regulator